jgi:hypothetical protein
MIDFTKQWICGFEFRARRWPFRGQWRVRPRTDEPTALKLVLDVPAEDVAGLPESLKAAAGNLANEILKWSRDAEGGEETR